MTNKPEWAPDNPCEGCIAPNPCDIRDVCEARNDYLKLLSTLKVALEHVRDYWKDTEPIVAAHIQSMLTQLEEAMK
jgi:hypothetical protein